MIICRTHKATYPRHDSTRAMCWGHLEKVSTMTSTDVCDPYWASVSWDKPYEAEDDL